MKGSEKQINWAMEILKPAQELINKFPEEIRGKHQRSLDRVENAATVINCRDAVDRWIEKTKTCMDTGIFPVAEGYCFGRNSDQPVVIRTVIF